jgi:acyl carrier protein
VPADKNKLPDFKDLRNQLRQLLPAYMVPELIVPVEKVAYTTTGKVDRNSLPALEWGGIAMGNEYVEARNIQEQKVAEIWRNVLKVDRISIHDNFFELGGHSLLAIQILERIRKECRVSLPIHELFAAPTIASMAAAIEEKQHHVSELAAEVPLLSRRRHTSAAKVRN